VQGTLIRLRVDRLPGDRDPKPVWLWCSTTDLDAALVDRIWQSYLRVKVRTKSCPMAFDLPCGRTAEFHAGGQVISGLG